MFTILVVGRNDGYGINLHKRTAISLNCLAALCEEPEDEIIYVDCNTPEPELTLVEAIADTLTAEARLRVRAFRVSGEQMRRAIGDTPLPFSDELSRNVGIRRSNPRNQWLLSTNSDILIQALGTESFAEILKNLSPRFYLCPRVGIPAEQWQLLDRMDVGRIGQFCDEVIKRGVRWPPEQPHEWLRFRSVGDFQLAPREHWLQIAGCEEGMKLWGHSDANNARRLNLLNGGGRTPDLGHCLGVFHLNHTPSGGSAHEKVLPQNDWKTWVEDVTSPRSRNRDNWGLADTDLPVIRLEQRTGLDPAAIMKLRPRPRSYWASLKVRLGAWFWRRASAVADRVERRSQ